MLTRAYHPDRRSNARQTPAPSAPPAPQPEDKRENSKEPAESLPKEQAGNANGYDTRSAATHGEIIEIAHSALRAIDAGDPTSPIPEKDLDAVADAVAAIEAFARSWAYPLTEFRGVARRAAQ